MGGDRVRWGILGAARIAVRRVLPALLRSERSAVVAIASRDRDRATDTAQQFQIPKVHPSYDALLADPEVDAVYNPLPNSLHHLWTLRSAEAGKHVLCEKPLALNAREAQQMVEVCRRRGVLLQEAFMYRFHPQTTPWLVRSAFTFLVATDEDIRLNPELGGGGLMDVGCYCVNIGRLLFGEPHTAFAASNIEGGVDVRLAGLLRFGGDRVAEFDCGVRAPFRQFCEVVGASGSIMVERPFQPEERPASLLIRRGDQERRVEIPGTNQYVRMIAHFVDCVLSQRPPRYPPEDAVANMRVIDALRESAKSGQTVGL
ncbi:MAG: Gfo/Idh/MocA family oxidoreductase [Armatimonadetes bacterium]|nr:Gfo/Idh/MocA family oxidoreductase [Armatimonadota bacterium]